MMRSSMGVMVALCVALAGCSDIFRPSYDYAEVEVSAVDLEGQPVPRVRLTLYSGNFHLEQGVTGADGRYTFHFVPAGVYGVESGAPVGYDFLDAAPHYQLLSVEQGDETAIEFVFRELR